MKKKRQKRRKSKQPTPETAPLKLVPFDKSMYDFECKCGEVWRGHGRPVETCVCGRDVISGSLFKESKRI